MTYQLQDTAPEISRRPALAPLGVAAFSLTIVSKLLRCIIDNSDYIPVQ